MAENVKVKVSTEKRAVKAREAKIAIRNRVREMRGEENYWRVMADKKEIEKKIGEQRSIISKAEQEIAYLETKHAEAPARLADVQRRIDAELKKLKNINNPLLERKQKLLERLRKLEAQIGPDDKTS